MDPDSVADRLERLLAPGSPAEPVTGPVAPPRVADHEILKQIGSGSYGGVWLARSVSGQLRAVKVVWRSRFTSERPYEREFHGIREFEPISRSHPGVMNVLHIGRDDDAGCYYYVMELADDVGESRVGGTPGATTDATMSSVDIERYRPRTLASELKARGRLPLTEVLTLGIQIADALGHLHRHRLVHRDVKPSNVIFVGGNAKIADIGLVTGAEDAKSFVGTEGFIPPEGPGSPQADLFGLGRLLYEAATGNDRCEFPDLPADFDAWSPADRSGFMELNEILARVCAPKPSHRHANAAELAGDLNILLAGRSIRRSYGIERRLKRATLTIGLVALAALLALAGLWFQQRARIRAEARARREAALRERADRAEQQSQELVRESLLHQALALTKSSEPDRRSRALQALGQAASIRPGLDLRNAAAAALATPELHMVRRWSPCPVKSMAQPDRELRRYARANPDGTVSVHSMQDDAEVARIPAVGTPAERSLFSPDGSRLAVEYTDGMLRVWSMTERSDPLEVLSRATAFEFTPDSRRILVTSNPEGVLRSYDVVTHRQAYRLRVGGLAGYVAVHPTEPLFLLSGYGERKVEVRRLDDGVVVRSMDLGETGLIVCWSADGKSLLAAQKDFSVRVWDWPSMGTPRLVLRFHRAEPSSLATDRSGRWLLTNGWDNRTALFDLRDGRLLLSEASNYVGAASARETFLLRNGALWSLVDLEPSFAFEAVSVEGTPTIDKGPRDVAFSPSGRWLVTAGPDGVRVLDVRLRRAHLVTEEETLRVAFSADSRRLYFVGSSRIGAWLMEDRADGDLRVEPARLPASVERSFDRSMDADDATISRDGERWVTSAMDPRSRRMSWIDGRFDSPKIEYSAGFGMRCDFPELSNDGRWLAWGNWQGRNASVTALGSADVPVEFPVDGSARVAFSPDSRLLVVGGPEEIRFYRAGTWDLEHSVHRQPSGTLPPFFAFTHDSRLCAVALPPDRVMIIDTVGGEEVITLPAEERFLARMDFSPDDRFLAACSTDHHVLIWDVAKLRGRLSELGLDWQGPAEPSPGTPHAPGVR